MKSEYICSSVRLTSGESNLADRVQQPETGSQKSFRQVDHLASRKQLIKSVWLSMEYFKNTLSH
jgi:hypothetical protein